MIPPDAAGLSPPRQAIAGGWGALARDAGPLPEAPARRAPRQAVATPAPAQAGEHAHGPGTAPRRAPRRVAASVPAMVLAAATAGLDMLAMALAGLGTALLPASGDRPGPTVVLLAALLLPGLVGFAGGYAHPLLFGAARGRRIALAGLAGTLGGLWLAGQALGAHGALPAGIAGLWLLGGAPLLLGLRGAGAAALRAAAPERVRRRALVVGDPHLAAALAAALGEAPDRSLTLVGLVEDAARPAAPRDPACDGRPPALPLLGGPDALGPLLRRGGVDEVVLALPWSDEERIAAMLRLLRDHPVEVRLAPDLAGYRARAAEGPPEAGRIHLPCLVGRPIGRIGSLVKAAEDMVLALVALAIVAVPMALIALAIRLDSPGPALFRQRRTGLHNREFHVLKFRTMYHEQADPEVVRQVVPGDARITPVGAILRRTSLDELPQLFNVLRGEMSFVGPRPHAPGTRAGGRLFEEVDPRYGARHRVKPGLTGLAQVRGWRGPTETEEKLIRRLDSDLEYIARWSPWLDFAILLRTLLAVVRMRNAC